MGRLNKLLQKLRTLVDEKRMSLSILPNSSSGESVWKSSIIIGTHFLH